MLWKKILVNMKNKLVNRRINMKIVNIKKFIRSIAIVLLIIIGLSLIISKSAYSRGEKQYKTIYNNM